MFNPSLLAYQMAVTAFWRDAAPAVRLLYGAHQFHRSGESFMSLEIMRQIIETIEADVNVAALSDRI